MKQHGQISTCGNFVKKLCSIGLLLVCTAAAGLLIHSCGSWGRVFKIKSAANVPIVFYGRVINQHNQPVSNVRVEAAYNSWGTLDILVMRPERFTNVFKSDAAGVFVVKGIKGQSLDLKLEKKGCDLAPHSLTSFGYGYPASPPNASSTNPVVYHVWERQGAAKLIQHDFSKVVTADGTPISLNFKTGRSETGSTNLTGVTVRVWREPLFNDRKTTLPTNWHYEVLGPKGIQFTDDIFRYVAPESGYQEKLVREFKEGDQNYSYSDAKNFYFINEQGQFGTGSVEVGAGYGGTVAFVALSVGWNPDGSRNLEPPE